MALEFIFMGTVHLGFHIQFQTFLVKILFSHRTYHLICFFIDNPIAMFNFLYLLKQSIQAVFFFFVLLCGDIIRFASIIDLIDYNVLVVIVII